jgi:hypothetical protein
VKLVICITLLFSLNAFAEVARDSNGHILRSKQARYEFVKAHPCPTGQVKGCKGYVVDHIIPLCAGGADKPSNMQWQDSASAKAKDVLERKQCRLL